MSADNGIFILRTLERSGDGYEYRVREIHAIENLYLANDKCLDLRLLISTFGGCATLPDSESALVSADSMLRERRREGHMVEYGIVEWRLDIAL
jgi:hypothetical protein